MTDESRAVDDTAYHEARVLLLIDAACQAPGSNGVLNGLTKLAKMDFLVRYPHVVGRVIDDMVDTPAAGDDPAVIDDPMIRYKYGPWDDRYYDVLGRLISRGLVAVTKGQRGALKFKSTHTGHETAGELASRSEWNTVMQACTRIASITSTITGNQLKNMIYERLPDLMDRSHREVIA